MWITGKEKKGNGKVLYEKKDIRRSQGKTRRCKEKNIKEKNVSKEIFFLLLFFRIKEIKR